VSNVIVCSHELRGVEMITPHIILDCLPSLFPKLSELVKIGRSYNKNNFACFFETWCSEV